MALAKGTLVKLPSPLPSADIRIGGNIRGKLTLLPGSVVTNNDIGIDTLSRPFFGFTDEIYNLLPKEGDPDEYFPSMRRTTYSVTEGRGRMSVANVVYAGIIDDALPNPVVEGGWTESSAQLAVRQSDRFANGSSSIYGGTMHLAPGKENTTPEDLQDDNDATAEANITYHTPVTTFKYITRKRPTGPRFRGVLLSGTADFSVVEIRPASIRGTILYVRQIRTVEFQTTKIGAYFQVMEKNQGYLVSPKIAKGVLAGTFSIVASGLKLNATR